MSDSNIQFELHPVEDAKKFLKYNNHYLGCFLRYNLKAQGFV